VRDTQHRNMSKSLGDGIDPMETCLEAAHVEAARFAWF
jgi:valyl-tRNA synthetase